MFDYTMRGGMKIYGVDSYDTEDLMNLRRIADAWLRITLPTQLAKLIGFRETKLVTNLQKESKDQHEHAYKYYLYALC